MLNIIKTQLERIINDIDTGNSNLQQQDLEFLADTLTKVGETKLSIYQAMKYLNIEKSTFYKMMKLGKIPQGRKQIGFKERYWLKSDIDKVIKERNKVK